MGLDFKVPAKYFDMWLGRNRMSVYNVFIDFLLLTLTTTFKFLFAFESVKTDCMVQKMLISK